MSTRLELALQQLETVVTCDLAPACIASGFDTVDAVKAWNELRAAVAALRQPRMKYKSQVVLEPDIGKHMDRMSGEGWRLRDFKKSRPMQHDLRHGASPVEWLFIWEREE